MGLSRGGGGPAIDAAVGAAAMQAQKTEDSR
jgi:hypothetical protein